MEFDNLDDLRVLLATAEGGRLVCNDASIAQQWALQGRGVLYQSELALTAPLASGELVRLFPRHSGELAPLYAVLPSRRYVPARVQALIKHLVARFETMPRPPNAAR